MNELQQQPVQRIKFRMLYRHAVCNFKRGSMSFPRRILYFRRFCGKYTRDQMEWEY